MDGRKFDSLAGTGSEELVDNTHQQQECMSLEAVCDLSCSLSNRSRNQRTVHVFRCTIHRVISRAFSEYAEII